jgi:hypothetical protein
MPGLTKAAWGGHRSCAWWWTMATRCPWPRRCAPAWKLRQRQFNEVKGHVSARHQRLRGGTETQGRLLVLRPVDRTEPVESRGSIWTAPGAGAGFTVRRAYDPQPGHPEDRKRHPQPGQRRIQEAQAQSGSGHPSARPVAQRPEGQVRASYPSSIPTATSPRKASCRATTSRACRSASSCPGDSAGEFISRPTFDRSARVRPSEHHLSQRSQVSGLPVGAAGRRIGPHRSQSQHQDRLLHGGQKAWTAPARFRGRTWATTPPRSTSTISSKWPNPAPRRSTASPARKKNEFHVASTSAPISRWMAAIWNAFARRGAYQRKRLAQPALCSRSPSGPCKLPMALGMTKVFPMGLISGDWRAPCLRPRQLREEFRLVKLWTSNVADALYIEPIQPLGLRPDGVITLQHALKRAIEAGVPGRAQRNRRGGGGRSGSPQHPDLRGRGR